MIIFAYLRYSDAPESTTGHADIVVCMHVADGMSQHHVPEPQVEQSEFAEQAAGHMFASDPPPPLLLLLAPPSPVDGRVASDIPAVASSIVVPLLLDVVLPLDEPVVLPDELAVPELL